ncbi:hypothetical protein O0I10_007513 [Lichtheimia ornata]|uniref:Uncharacterized protein n=1 Tax=Lichtheimia ornata TaxID=688661 RepID=A0AAD7XXX3_9FUNG|nr:uncharacterized protein O0I10_007513 [Lichtheimia ornata]KAJ8656916.1 hypothetical protein O0I10_007513 [Lichtheimia ornata]
MGWVRSKPPVEIQLPENDARILAKYEHRAKQFDEMIKICCCWIGYDVLLDFIPVVGKIISLGFSLSMYNLACKTVLPRALRRRMLYHISVDFVLGLIPILGIVLTALYRANTKNARLLRRFLYQRAEARQKQEQEMNQGGIGSSSQQQQQQESPSTASAPAAVEAKDKQHTSPPLPPRPSATPPVSSSSSPPPTPPRNNT